MTAPIWTPDLKNQTPQICHLIDFINDKYDACIDLADFSQLNDWSINNTADFWSALWDFHGVIGNKGNIILEQTQNVPYARFFPNGKISYAENMLAYWLENPTSQAIIYRHQNAQDRIISGGELCDQVSLWEQNLRTHGIRKGDVVGVYLSNVPETDIILLAASNIGATFCSAGMEMGGDDLITRFGAIRPKIIITAESYLFGDQIIDRTATIAKAKDKIDSIQHIIYIPIPGSDRDDQPLKNLTPQPLKFERHDFNHPLYILFSSGTTGVPKCFVHSSGGVLLKHISEHLQSDISAGQRIFFHATPSWMMWNWVTSGLAMGATILKYDGNPLYPDTNAQWQFTCDNACNHHGTAAPLIMVWRDKGLNIKDKLDTSALQTIHYSAAVLPQQGFEFLQSNIKSGVKISGVTGGTDLVGYFLCSTPLDPVYKGQLVAPMMGVDIQIWDENGKPLPAGEAGELVCTNAFPSMPVEFLNDTNGEKYNDAYFDFYKGKTAQPVWRHGDTIYKTEQGQYVIVGRSDGTLNQNGVRIGSGAIYNQLEPFKDQIKDSCAIDFSRPDNSQTIIVLFLVTENGDLPETLVKSIKSAVKDNVGPYSIPTEIIAVPGVLRNKNGKLAEVVTKKILAGKTIPNPDLYGTDLVKFYENLAKELQSKYS
jgi:acetoacetyl-CoA synthetase